METLLGHGILDWMKMERQTDRYGTIFLFPHSEEDEPLQFNTAQNGERGSLYAVVRQTRNSEHVGDLISNLYPQTPTVGDRIEMGSGKLFFEEEDSCVGVDPGDSRETDWMDPRALYRLHGQTVDLYFAPAASR